MLFPAAVISAGALVLIPASPALIFGLGPFPQLGIAGGAAAVVLYYSIGRAIFAGYIWSGRGVLRPPLIPPKFVWVPMLLCQGPRAERRRKSEGGRQRDRYRCEHRRQDKGMISSSGSLRNHA